MATINESQRATRQAASDASESVLSSAASVARYAPSIHNTQPWSWDLRDGVLRLTARRDRQLRHSDPSGRMLTVSCGASLLYARAAAAVQGWRSDVARLPDAGRPDLLAELTLAEPMTVSRLQARRFRSLMQRQTDRRALRPPAPGRTELADAVATAEAEGGHVHVVRTEQLVELAVAASHARAEEDADDEQQRELSHWLGRDSGADEGVPDTVIPSNRGHELVPPRFPETGRPGTLETDPDRSDTTAAYLVLYSDQDTPMAWLRSGEALARVWATLTDGGMAVTPLSSVVEQPAPRAALYRMLSSLGHPMLVLRAGYPEGEGGVPLTGRASTPAAEGGQ